MASRQGDRTRNPSEKPRGTDLDEALDESFPASDPLPTSPITGVKATDEPFEEEAEEARQRPGPGGTAPRRDGQ